MANPIKIIKNGIINENPTFVQVIGMCPTLAVTSSAINGIGMGLSTTAVLIFANLFISLLRKVIPDTVRIPCFIVVIATFVTIIEFLLKAYLPERIPGSVHSTDRSKLSDSGACRSIRFQKWSRCFRIRWYRYGSWFHHRSGLSGSGA